MMEGFDRSVSGEKSPNGCIFVKRVSSLRFWLCADGLDGF